MSSSPVAQRTAARPYHPTLIQALREQGFEIHESVMSTEGMIYGVRSAVASAWVKGGDELAHLAAGRITLAEIAVRQPKPRPTPPAGWDD